MFPLYFENGVLASIDANNTAYVVNASFVDLDDGVDLTIVGTDYKNGAYVEFHAAGASVISFVGVNASGTGSITLAANDVLRLMWKENGWLVLDGPAGGS